MGRTVDKAQTDVRVEKDCAEWPKKCAVYRMTEVCFQRGVAVVDVAWCSELVLYGDIKCSGGV